MQKTVQFYERLHAEFRAEFFNIFNHAQFLNPDGNISDANFNPDGLTVNTQPPGSFGRVLHTREPRQIQFALKFSF